MIQNKILHSAKLSYKVVKGSSKFRDYKAEQFTHCIMNNLVGTLQRKEISLSKFARLLKSILSENLKIVIKKDIAAESSAQLNCIFLKSNNIGGFSFEMKTNENNKINFLEIPIIAHEIRHLADYIFHPKKLAREQIRAKKRLNILKFTDFYDKEIYVKELFEGKKDKKRILKLIKYATNKVLKGLSVHDKLDILQGIRYELISENNAFKTGRRYAKALYKKNLSVYKDFLFDQTKEYMFEEKINLFENMILLIIKKERGIHKSKIKKRILKESKIKNQSK